MNGKRKMEHFGSIDPFFYTAVRAAYSIKGAQWVRQMNRHTWQNDCLLKTALQREVPEIKLAPLEGTFVVWMDLRALGLSDEQLVEFLKEKVQVLVIQERNMARVAVDLCALILRYREKR